MKILVLADSRAMWPQENSWPNSLRAKVPNLELFSYIGGINHWLITLYMMEDHIKQYDDNFFDLIIVQAGWHDGGPCYWTRKVWEEVVGEAFDEKMLVDEINHKGHKQYLYIDREAEAKIFETFHRKGKKVLAMGLHCLRGGNDLNTEFQLGMKHHYGALDSNEAFSKIRNVDFLNLPMDDEWVIHNTLNDNIHFNNTGVEFTSNYIVRYINRIGKTVNSILPTLSNHKELYIAAEKAGAKINSICKKGDRVVFAKFDDNLLAEYLGCISYGIIPIIIQTPSNKVFKNEIDNKMAGIREKINPTLCICSEENRDYYSKYFNTITTLPNETKYEKVEVTPEDIVLIQLSSGTTGDAKILEITHKKLIENCVEYASGVEFNDKSITVSWLPLYHDMGLIAGFLLPLLNNAKFEIINTFEWLFNPKLLLEKITQLKATHVWVPNFALGMMANKISDLDGLDLSSIIRFISCSEPTTKISANKFRKFQSVGLNPNAICNSYALAENVFGVTISQGIKEIERENKNFVSCGYTIAGVSIIITKDNEDITSTGEIGQVMIRSLSTPKTNQISDFYGYYDTGDLGFIDRGELYITGRGKDAFNYFGKNIYPELIENALNEIPGIHPGRVTCVGVPNNELGTHDVYIIAEIDSNNEKEISQSISALCKNDYDISPIVNLFNFNFIIKTSSGKASRSRTISKLQNFNLLLDLVNKFLKDKNKDIINKYDHLHSSGLLDSLDMLELVLFLERNKFNLKLKGLKLDMSIVDTVENILENVE